MKDKWKRIENGFQMLLQSIYKEDRLERNLSVITWIGLIIAGIGSVMTCINMAQQKGFVTWTTAIAAGAGLWIAYSAKVLKSRRPAVIAALFICVFLFTYYAVSGVNDGFAILWTMLVPLAISYFGGVIYGVSLSGYYEILFVALFYTPLRNMMGQFYTETFMNRFPVLYLCNFLLNSVAMIHYHMTTLAQIQNEKKLEEAVQDALAAGRAKSQFLAQMSHEIRTPINAVLGMNEMILREASDENVLDYSETIQEAGKTLLNLINSILDFSKIEDGKMEIIPTEYATSSLIHNLAYSVSERARIKGLDFVIDIDETLPSVLIGDDVRLTQIVSNLLTNAVKYTEKGYVKLSIRNAGRRGDDVKLSISVKDTGIGIQEKDREKMFESFERLDEIRNRNIEGTGLGMAIVTKLLEMMGSEIHLYSVYGEGSNFFFELLQGVKDETPIGKYSSKSARSKKENETEQYLYTMGAKVLVVDDNEMNLKVIKNLLRRCGITPALADSGKMAIELIRKENFDIVFMDHMMPEMDGIETLRCIKEEGLMREGMTVIALTANAVVGAREMYLQAGFKDYLSKPVETKGLEEKLSQYLPAEKVEWRSSGRGTKNEKVKETPAQEPEVFEFDAVSSESGDVLEFAPVKEEGKQEGQESGKIIREMQNLGLDTEKGMTFCGGDEEFYVEVLQDFLNMHQHKAKELQTDYEQGDWKGYRILIHSLKSSSKTIGALEVSDMAKELEMAADQEDTSYLENNHGAFVKAYDELADRIKRGFNP